MARTSSAGQRVRSALIENAGLLQALVSPAERIIKLERGTMQRGRHIHLAALAGALALAAWSGRTALASPPAPTATGLPAGFNAVALGADTTDAQSVSVDASGAWTVKAGGAGLTDTDGGIGIYQKLSGNGSIIAHVA